MKNFFKSRVGLAFAGIYFLLILYAAVEGIRPPPKPMDGFAMLILTAPWSFLLLILLDNWGIIGEKNGDSFLPLFVIVGGLINATILYLIGYLLTRMASYFSSKRKK